MLKLDHALGIIQKMNNIIIGIAILGIALIVIPIIISSAPNEIELIDKEGQNENL